MKLAQTEISLPQCEKGIGDVILSADSPRLIDGVKCADSTLWPDDRGYFLEVQRAGLGFERALPERDHPDFRRIELPRASSRHSTFIAIRPIAGLRP